VTLEDEVMQIAADVFQAAPGTLTPESSPGSVEGWDSAQHLNLVLALEQRFRVEFLPEEFDQMQSLGEIAALLRSKPR
jgi:acyl carrier protein